MTNSPRTTTFNLNQTTVGRVPMGGTFDVVAEDGPLLHRVVTGVDGDTAAELQAAVQVLVDAAAAQAHDAFQVPGDWFDMVGRAVEGARQWRRLEAAFGFQHTFKHPRHRPAS